MSYIADFMRNNLWIHKVENTGFRTYIALTEDHSVRLLVWDDKDVGIVDDAVGRVSGFFNRDTYWHGLTNFKDFKNPTDKEKKLFYFLYGWDIPWSEEKPLVL